MNRIQSRTLSCGMPLVVEHMSTVRSAAVQWMVPGGSADDPANRLGRAAMWSELLMRGSGPRDSRTDADAFDKLGASRSADVGTFFMRVGATTLGERLHDVLPLLVDMVRTPRFDADAIEPSRDLALQSIESLQDDPQERAMLGARSRHYAAPLDRSGMGTPEGLRALTRDELISGWGSIALPRRAVFAAAGHVDIDALAPQLDALLAGWTGGTDEPPRGENPPRGYAHETDESNQVQIVVLHDAPSEPDADSLLEKLLVSVLSGGMSGRLFSEVREKRGLCYSVSAGYSGGKDFGGVTAYVGTTPERAQESLDVLLGQLQRVHTPEGRITPDEFQRAVIGMKSRLIFSGESTGARASALAADMHRMGRPRSLAELATEVDRVTLDQLNAYAARREMGRLTIQTLGPAPLKSPV